MPREPRLTREIGRETRKRELRVRSYPAETACVLAQMYVM